MRIAHTAHNSTHAHTPADMVKLGPKLAAIVESVSRRMGLINLLHAHTPADMVKL